MYASINLLKWNIALVDEYVDNSQHIEVKTNIKYGHVVV
jgi:hypothetical protein